MADLSQHLESGSTRLESVGIEYRFARSLDVAGVSQADVTGVVDLATRAAEAFQQLVDSGESPGMTEPVLWPRLGEGGIGNWEASLAAAEAWAQDARSADVVISIGIGGSYLGNRVLRDALLGTEFNALSAQLKNDPELHFAGFHLDPNVMRQLAALLSGKARLGRSPENPLQVKLLAISKSGTTTETLATTLALIALLEEIELVDWHLAALTAPGSNLAELVKRTENATLIPFPEGIGGRWSVLSPVGLATAAATNVSVEDLLNGARAVRDELLQAGGDLTRNPALLYATLHHLHGLQGRTGAVFMPYAECLRCISEWYVQLLAESLGKAQDREGNTVNTGRTPIVAVGTTDMHAQTQLHQGGRHDKTVTTLDVREWGEATVDLVPEDPGAGKLSGKTFAELNTLARESNEEALHGDGRPSDALILDRLDAKTLGGLLYLLMATVAYEGELLNVCAYDQPGVEAYKTIMKARL